PPRAPSIKEVLWQPPPMNWMKCNTDGAYNTIKASCGAELCGVMKAVEIANIHNWLNIWIETDSNFAILAFKSNSLVPWMVRNRWQNCLNTDNVLFFWDPTSCIVNSLNRNKLGIPNFSTLATPPFV
ncbi:ribonuclease H, partial [Trifolium pratense]